MLRSLPGGTDQRGAGMPPDARARTLDPLGPPLPEATSARLYPSHACEGLGEFRELDRPACDEA